MDHCVASKKVVECLREKAEAVQTERNEPKASWEVQVKKLNLMRKNLEELEAQVVVFRKVLMDKEGEISSMRKQIR